jgi:hypothetical protein
VFGLRPDRYLLDRANWMREAWPIDVVEVNQEHAAALGERDAVCFGDYPPDGSLLCVTREGQSVNCFREGEWEQVRASWSSIADWLKAESERLSGCFDESGMRLVPEQELLPHTVH